MRILLDEQVPEPAVEPLRRLLAAHEVDHGRQRGRYDVVVSTDDAVPGFHRVRFRPVGAGIARTASALATVIAGLPAAVARLDGESTPCVVVLAAVRPGRYEVTGGRSMRP